MTRYETDCEHGGSAELWAINGGGHNPVLSGTFSRQVVDYLLARTNESAKVPVPVPALSPVGGMGLAMALAFTGVRSRSRLRGWRKTNR